MAAFEPSVRFSSTRLETVFNRCFLQREQTRLVGGGPEPVYRPATTPGGCHSLCYREDFFASALHEVAHWCIAGPRRRQLVDFGYWYAPEGRDPEQQSAFEAVEVKPQALEWIFSRACGYRFRVSVDNLDPVSGRLAETSGFRRRVARQAERYFRGSMPPRALEFFHALREEFGIRESTDVPVFDAGEIA